MSLDASINVLLNEVLVLSGIIGFDGELDVSVIAWVVTKREVSFELGSLENEVDLKSL